MALTQQQKWQATNWLLTDVVSIAAYLVLLLGVVMMVAGDRPAAITGTIGCVVVVAVLAQRFRRAWTAL